MFLAEALTRIPLSSPVFHPPCLSCSQQREPVLLLPKHMRETHVQNSSLPPNSLHLSQDRLPSQSLWIAWHLQHHHLVQIPHVYKYSVTKALPRLQPHMEVTSHLLLDFNLPLSFQFVLWERIRPGFPQVPQFYSMAGQLFHLQPHVEADKQSSDTNPT